MKLFGFNTKKKETGFRITEPDRNWVEENFKWLIQVYGLKEISSEQILLNEKFFPKTFSHKNVLINNLIEDLISLFNLESTKISYRLQEDIRDSYNTPYEIEGKPFEAETIITNGNYNIVVAKSLIKHPNRLVFSLIIELIKIHLAENKLNYDTGEDADLFIHLAGIYLGFGIILSENLINIGFVTDGIMETKWNYISDMPNEVMVFALASFSKLNAQDNPNWKTQLSKKSELFFDDAIKYLNDSPSIILNKGNVEIYELFHQSEKEYKNGDYVSAINSLKKIIPLTEDELFKSDIFNNIGYYQIRNGEIESSILNFQKSIEIDSNYGFANDNLGYALINKGELEKGKKFIEKAFQTQNNDNAYSYRNLALYYHKKGEFELAKENFDLAFEHITFPVDLLEFHYGDFLISQGEKVEGIKFIQKGVEKGEQEAIIRMKELS